MKDRKPGIHRALALEAAVLLVGVGLIALGYVLRKPMLINYHRLGAHLAIKAMHRHAKPQPGDRYRRDADRFSRHRKALIGLGYLARREFRLNFLTVNSPQFEHMLAEYRSKYPNESPSSYTVGTRMADLSSQDQTQGPSTQERLVHQPSFVHIDDLAKRMSVWEKLILEYDVPPTDPCQPLAPPDS